MNISKIYKNIPHPTTVHCIYAMKLLLLHLLMSGLSMHQLLLMFNYHHRQWVPHTDKHWPGPPEKHMWHAPNNRQPMWTQTTTTLMALATIYGVCCLHLHLFDCSSNRRRCCCCCRVFINTIFMDTYPAVDGVIIRNCC